MRLLFISFFVLVFGGQALAESWHVERDGSGDFSLLQEAADVAASGDTIFVGSGRYDEWQVYGNAGHNTARMIIESKDLVVIGEMDGSTVIGPDVPFPIDEPGNDGIVLVSGNNLIIRNVHFSNLGGGIMSWIGGSVEVFDCDFVENDTSILVSGGRGEIYGCGFRTSRRWVTQVLSYFADELLVEDCEFDTSSLVSHSLDIAGSVASIKDCRFIGGGNSFTIDRGAQARIQNCSLSGGRYGFYIGVGAPEVEIVDCSMSDLDVAVNCTEEDNTIKLDSCIITDVETATFVAGHLNRGYVRNCILAKGERGVVLAYRHFYDEKGVSADDFTVNEFDMRDNDWGTTDPDSIQAWIDDNSDDPEVDYRILWDPYLGQPVANTKKEFGSLKSMFR